MSTWLKILLGLLLLVIIAIFLFLVYRKKIEKKKEEEKDMSISLIFNCDDDEEETEEEKQIKNQKEEDTLIDIINRQNESMRNSSISEDNNPKTEEEKQSQITQLIKDMSIMGDIVKKRIIKEKKTNPGKFMTIEEATKDKESPNFAIGLLAQNLEVQGVTTAIVKEGQESELDKKCSSTTLQFMVNGMGTQKKHQLHFDFDKKRNIELKNNENEQKIFSSKIKAKLSNEYNINEIIVFSAKRPVSSLFDFYE